MFIWFDQTPCYAYVFASLVVAIIWILFLLWIAFPIAESRLVLSNPWSIHHSPSTELPISKRRMAGSAHPGLGPPAILPGTLKNPCQTNTSTSKTNDLYYCYQNNRTLATVVLDKRVFSIGGRSAMDWDGYAWYLDSIGYKLAGHDWQHVFSTTDKSWPPRSYGTSDRARVWRKQVQLTNMHQSLILSINTTILPFGKPARVGVWYPNPPCHTLALCVWRPHETDPCVTLSFCPNLTETSQIPTLTKGPKSISPIQSKIMINPTVDDWFKVTTGISKINNNWLIMAEQAANASNTDCIVCMGPRPLLRVVPAPMT
ncbi:uncharacterized protein LOC106535656, partial [Austrofundulus limnaeus]|uniref:Uncharacterized protein LOC106535656 n=1 Tax=Austrofundulus limnaeus TaxID=52670 RepID=A0A2I4D7G8_AUSLI